jgi:hypothetical protein
MRLNTILEKVGSSSRIQKRIAATNSPQLARGVLFCEGLKVEAEIISRYNRDNQRRIIHAMKTDVKNGEDKFRGEYESFWRVWVGGNRFSGGNFSNIAYAASEAFDYVRAKCWRR